MGKSSPSPPTPPDPTKTAQAQGQMNKETAIAQQQLNMVDQYAPWGSMTYSQIAGPGMGGGGGGSARPQPSGPSASNAGKAPSQSSGLSMDERAHLRNLGFDAGSGSGGLPNSLSPEMMQEITRYRAGQQGGGNQGANFIDRGGASGSGGYAGGDVPRYAQTINLSPEQQRLYDLQTQLGIDTSRLAVDQTGRIEQALSQPFSLDGLPSVRNPNEWGIDDFSEDRQQVADTLYGMSERRLDPQFQQERERMETQLANMGITRGTEAFNREMDRYMRGRTDAYGDARDRSILAGGQEQSRLMGERGNLYGLEQNARERAIQELMLQRSQPINEAAALLGTGPGLMTPQFTQPPQSGIQAPDYQGAVANQYAGQMANYQQQLQQQNAAMGGLFGLGGSVLSAGLRPGGFLL